VTAAGPNARELTTLDEVARACADDALCVWAAQGMAAGVRAWAADGAVAVVSPDVCRRDRLAVHGPAAPVAALTAEVLPLLPPSYRLLGDADLISSVAGELPGLAASAAWGWMESVRPAGGHRDSVARRDPEGVLAGWLEPHELGTVEDLLDTGFPNSFARPGDPGVRRWAGIRDSARRLVAVAADAWSAPTVGFMAGVAVHPNARGQRLAGMICSFVARELLTAHGRVCLMADESNTPAVRTYERLGFTWRTIRSARVVDAPAG
jgi:ribosomal protein S18 acetylase RimI-like enzyme